MVSNKIKIMIKILVENLLQLLIVSPIIYFSLKNRNSISLKILLAFTFYFMFRICFLHLPVEYSQTNFIKGNWNWSGKLYAIISSVVFLLIYRKFELKDYFLTIRQNQKFIKKGIIIIGILLLIGSMMSFFLSTPKEWDIESILFQLFMPGLDEEIAYRAIMLGLLTKVLIPEIRFNKLTLGNPAIWITALLFGFAHSFFLTDSYGLEFRVFPFITTMIKGTIWGWITIKSGSILLALLSHSLGNVSDKLIRMR